MANDRVVPLKKGGRVPGIRYKPDEDVVAELEYLLDLARSGEIIGFGYASVWADNATGNRYVGGISRSAVGALFSVMDRMTKQLDEDST